MFEVTAVVRLDEQDDVIRALHEIPDLPGVTLSVVEGIGRRQSMEGEAPQPFGRVSMAKIEIVVGADRLARVMAASCEELGSDEMMTRCAAACRRCAESCQRMAGMVTS